jgi:hypothetical protein
VSEQTRVVLSPEVTRDDVETAAWDLDLFIHHRTSRSGDQPREDVWRSRDESTWLHEVEDHVTGLRYLVLRGEEVDAIVRRLRRLVRTVTHSDALRALDDAENAEDKLLALYQLGAAAPDHANSRVAAALRRTLDDDDPDLRHAAVVAIAYTGWPELEEAVRAASEADPSETVRSAARRLLQAYAARPAPGGSG